MSGTGDWTSRRGGGGGGGKATLSAWALATQLGEPEDADRAWRTLQGRLLASKRARARRIWFALPTLALGGVGALVLAWSLRHAPDRSIEVGHAFESADAEVALSLPDGVEVDLDRRSQVRLESVAPEEIRVALGKGSARFDVEPRQHRRRFIVDADDVEVRVVGTRFRVTRTEAGNGDDGPRIAIAVERGIVEVRDRRRQGEPHRLRAGERFSMPAVSAVDEPPNAASAAPEMAASPPARAQGSEAPNKAPAAASARALLERAQVAWRAGRMSEAAAAYEEVLARHPTDARAALAALELGRIQMDHLADTAAATASFERALRLAPHAAFREDTLARLVRANERLGREAECRRVRDAYLRQYANGIHAATVSSLCR